MDQSLNSYIKNRDEVWRRVGSRLCEAGGRRIIPLGGFCVFLLFFVFCSSVSEGVLPRGLSARVIVCVGGWGVPPSEGRGLNKREHSFRQNIF